MVLIASLTVSNACAAEPRLLRPGTYHGHEVTAVTGERWLAVVRAAEGADRLVPVTIRVDIVRDELLDDTGPATGKLVSAAPGGDAIVFLVRDVPGLRPGPVTTLATDTPVTPGEPVRLAWRGQPYSLSLECTTPDRGQGSEQVACSLVVRGIHGAQTLRDYDGYHVDGAFGGVGDDAQPNVLWAGDLDGDHGLDLLIDLTDHYNVARPTLFLSRGRRSGVMLERVAAHESVGC
jgi:hypothetical protein